MKKTFPLTAAGKADARVVEAIKHDIRKYVKRERKKPVPPDFDEWDFACKVGVEPASAENKQLKEIGAAIDAVASSGARAAYVEVLAVPARRTAPSSTVGAAPQPTESSTHSETP